VNCGRAEQLRSSRIDPANSPYAIAIRGAPIPDNPDCAGRTVTGWENNITDPQDFGTTDPHYGSLRNPPAFPI